MHLTRLSTCKFYSNKKPDLVHQALDSNGEQMNNDILEQHPCAGKCTDLKEKGDCGHCMIPEKVCLSNSAKNEIQSDLSIESGSQFKVGDKVIRLDNESKHIYSIQKIENELITVVRRFRHKTYGFWVTSVDLRHTTPAEIKAGHRIDESSLDELMDSALKSREEAKKSAVALREEVQKHFGGDE